MPVWAIATYPQYRSRLPLIVAQSGLTVEEFVGLLEESEGRFENGSQAISMATCSVIDSSFGIGSPSFLRLSK